MNKRLYDNIDQDVIEKLISEFYRVNDVIPCIEFSDKYTVLSRRLT